MYLDLDNVPFYIGKGQGDRYKIVYHLGKDNTNSLLKNKIRKVGTINVKTHFLHENISEEEAFSWERYWIKYIGRRDLKEGTLCNLTEVGEGMSGRECSEETKQKIGETLKGRKLSEETKQKMRGPRKPYGPKSETAKQKMSVAKKGKPSWNKGVPCPEKQKQKISKAQKGKKLSNKTKQKMSEAAKRGWVKRRRTP